jgi:hypothetical protein
LRRWQPSGGGTDDGWATIAGQYGSTGKKQQAFGRVDPFCLFAVLPMLVIAGLFILGGIAVLGVVVILLAALVVVGDSWANRPSKRTAPPRRRLSA